MAPLLDEEADVVLQVMSGPDAGGVGRAIEGGGEAGLPVGGDVQQQGWLESLRESGKGQIKRIGRWTALPNMTHDGISDGLSKQALCGLCAWLEEGLPTGVHTCTRAHTHTSARASLGK